MLSSRGRSIVDALDSSNYIREKGLIDLRHTARWVDDFKKHFRSHEEAWQAGSAYILLHARWGIRLKSSKFEGPSQTVDFGGVDFHGKGALQGLSKEKVEKICGKLAPVLLGQKMNFLEWESLCGSINFAARAFPSGKGFVSPFFSAKAGAKAAAEGGSVKYPFLLPPLNASRAARFWKEALLLAPPRAASFSRSPMTDLSEADVIVHSDWAPEEGDNVIGIFILSHGLWCYGKAPEYFSKMAVGPDGRASSPALEGLAESMLLATFPEIVDGKNVLLFTDNIPWIQATMKMTSSSLAVDHALQISALAQITYNAHIVRRYVPTHLNLADPLSHRLVQRFRDMGTSVGLCAALSPSTPRFVSPPPSWAHPQPSL
jgi:hypothetical protein